MKNNIEYKLYSLSKSKFRSSFKLKINDLAYIKEKGLEKIKSHAYDFINDRLKSKEIKNEGKQTPMKGHPVFIAQHATGTCCRNCLYKWHKINKNKELSNEEIDYIVKLIMKWITNQIKEEDMNNNLAVVISNDNICSPLETIDAIKKVGFNNVFIQWYDKEYKEFDISQERQLQYIKDNNLNVIFAHLGYKDINNIWLDNEIGEELLQKYLRNLEECRKNKINMVIMHLCSKEIAPGPNELGLKRLRIICNKAKELNIKVAFENTKIKGYLEYVLSNINQDNVGICYDAGHVHAHFKDEFNFEVFKDKIFAVHLHDNFGSIDEHLIPFDGTINWKYVMKKLKECNYNGPITLELCYRNKYSSMTPEEFYTKGLEVGNKLYELLNK